MHFSLYHGNPVCNQQMYLSVHTALIRPYVDRSTQLIAWMLWWQWEICQHHLVDLPFICLSYLLTLKNEISHLKWQFVRDQLNPLWMTLFLWINSLFLSHYQLIVDLINFNVSKNVCFIYIFFIVVQLKCTTVMCNVHDELINIAWNLLTY